MQQKNRWRVTALVLAAALIVPTAGPVTSGAKQKLALNRKKVTLKVGKTCLLKVKGTKKKVRWSSSRTSIASVSKKGKVKAKRQGTAKIKAKVTGRKSPLVCRVTVKKKTNGDKSSEQYRPQTHTTPAANGPQNDGAGAQTPTQAPAATPDGSQKETPVPGDSTDQTPKPDEKPANSGTPVQSSVPGPTATAKPVVSTEPSKSLVPVEADPVPDGFFQTSKPAYETGKPESPELSADSGV